jgi:UDP-hydrolysing UDP-N-acetyl-D-glucosamine 2-epimerase
MADTRRRICVLTGTRAEYGLLRTLMRTIESHPKLELQTLVTGTHLVKEFGHSVDRVRADGFCVSGRIPMYKTANDVREELPESLGKVVARTGKWLIEHKSDAIVVLGDRVEALGGALAGLTANIPVAHLHGGELAAGDMDDRIRFAISAMASLHFVSTPDARRRLLRCGEPSDRIFVVGAMAMDEIFQINRIFASQPELKDNFRKRLGLPLDRPMLIVVHHPCGFGAKLEFQYMEQILNAVSRYDGIIIGPNNDPGHSGIRKAIGRFLKEKKGASSKGQWRYFDNLAREEYLLALWSGNVLVGNSSSGILEANAMGTAVINIGPRQKGREKNGNAIIDCGYTGKEIQQALTRMMAFSSSHKIRSLSRFGTGEAGTKITRVLARLSKTRDLLVKSRS